MKVYGLVPEDYMSLCCDSRNRLFREGAAFYSDAFALRVQRLLRWPSSRHRRKFDLFAGYQWLNPGGNIPSSGTDASGTVLPVQVAQHAGRLWVGVWSL